jgi:hypothetical protein
MASMARLLLVWVLLFAYAPPTAEGQTTDSGLGGIASTSTASVAKEMHAAIRRNLAEAASTMPAEPHASRRGGDGTTCSRSRFHLRDSFILDAISCAMIRCPVALG